MKLGMHLRLPDVSPKVIIIIIIITIYNSATMSPFEKQIRGARADYQST